MQPTISSRPFEVTNSKLAEVLFNQEQRDLLAAFILEQSPKEAAEKLGISLAQLYPRLQRLEKLGLLIVTKTEARAGRAIKYYRVVAEEFLIPNRAVTIEDLHEKQDALRSKQLWHCIYKAGFPGTQTNPDWGMRVFYHQRNGFVLQATWSEEQDWDLLDERHPVFLPYWYKLKMSKERARAMQRELHDVFFKYVNAQDDDSETYMIRVAMAPIVE